MENGVIKTYKKGRKIICYITHYNGVFATCTGKPSDASCISWRYDNCRMLNLRQMNISTTGLEHYFKPYFHTFFDWMIQIYSE